MTSTHDQSELGITPWVVPDSAVAHPPGGSGNNRRGEQCWEFGSYTTTCSCPPEDWSWLSSRESGGGGGGRCGAAGGGALGVRAGANGRAAPQVQGGGGSGGVQKPEPQSSPSRSRVGGGAMACAGLLTVCLIRPPAPEPRRPPAPTAAAGPTGHALFQDVSGARALWPWACHRLSSSVPSPPVSRWLSLSSPPPPGSASLCAFLSLPAVWAPSVSASRCLSLTPLSPFSLIVSIVSVLCFSPHLSLFGVTAPAAPHHTHPSPPHPCVLCSGDGQHLITGAVPSVATLGWADPGREAWKNKQRPDF